MSAQTSTENTAAPRALDDPPGGLLMWIVVALELAAFAMVLGLIAYLRGAQTAVFRAGQAALHPGVGLALTLSLITSGWLAAEGVHAFRRSEFSRARRFYGAAVGTGLVFVGVKLYDYQSKVAAGFGLGTNDFWDAYFLGTGFHFLHVLVGLVLLAVVGRKIGRAKFEDAETAVAGTALFWHMCDLVWFFLFPLFFARS